jgi:hypothetical protein
MLIEEALEDKDARAFFKGRTAVAAPFLMTLLRDSPTDFAVFVTFFTDDAVLEAMECAASCCSVFHVAHDIACSGVPCTVNNNELENFFSDIQLASDIFALCLEYNDLLASPSGGSALREVCPRLSAH